MTVSGLICWEGLTLASIQMPGGEYPPAARRDVVKLVDGGSIMIFLNSSTLFDDPVLTTGSTESIGFLRNRF